MGPAFNNLSQQEVSKTRVLSTVKGPSDEMPLLRHSSTSTKHRLQRLRHARNSLCLLPSTFTQMNHDRRPSILSPSLHSTLTFPPSFTSAFHLHHGSLSIKSPGTFTETENCHCQSQSHHRPQRRPFPRRNPRSQVPPRTPASKHNLPPLRL